MTIHQDLQAHINRSRGHQDRDVAIEELEAANARIDVATGTKLPGKLPKLDKGATADEALNEARTCIRNDDLTGARIRMAQAIAAGGGSAPEVDEDKALEDMTKAELFAYADARDYAVARSNGKPALLAMIQELDAAGDKSIHDMTRAELVAYAAAQDPPMEITADGDRDAILGQIQEAHDTRNE